MYVILYKGTFSHVVVLHPQIVIRVVEYIKLYSLCFVCLLRYYSCRGRSPVPIQVS